MIFMKRMLVVLIVGWAVTITGAVQAQFLGPNEEIPFIPTPIEVIDRMLDLAEVTKGDVVYDLGSGDGRIVIRAAKKFGVRAVGIEMDQILLAEARKAAKKAGVRHLVE